MKNQPFIIKGSLHFSINKRVHLQKLFFCIIFFLPLASIAQSSLQANFAADTLNGCSPVVVQLQDISSGNPISWNWDFGNGVTSSLQNPKTSFADPGSYTVTLTITDKSGNTNTITKNNFITVYPPPDIQFSLSPTSGCFPLKVNFTDQSSTSLGYLTKWLWDFGDGDTSDLQNPEYVYTKSGSYNVSLVVTNNFGCINAKTENKAVNIPNGVQAAFTNSDSTSCQQPLTVNFTNASSGPSSLSYQWDFGDGSGSNDKNPGHTYKVPGSYTVTLITNSSTGCTDSLQKSDLVNIARFQSDFDVPSICQGNNVTFTNTSVPLPASASWYFSDGKVINGVNASRTFTAQGKYSVKLVNQYEDGCLDSLTKEFTVSPKPAAAFTTVKKTGCNVPLQVSFSDQSSNAVSWFWDFGDGATSTVQSPVHTYTTSDTYDVKLVVTNASGCQDSLIKKDYIKALSPQVSFTTNQSTGCLPLNVNFSGKVVSNDNVQSYTWNFGDGTTASGKNPTHQYTKEGIYDVSLTVNTQSGCTVTDKEQGAITVGNKPKVDFSADITTACQSTAVSFSDKSDKGTMWTWDFGDGKTSAEQNPKHNFADTGRFDVKLIVNNFGCIDSATKKKYIYIKPPVANFSVNRDCATPYKIGFEDKSISAESYQWDFGDGSVTSNLESPTHTYSAPGTYKVELMIHNGACTSSSADTYNIIDEQPDITADQTNVCEGSYITLAAAGINTNNIISYTWKFSDGTYYNGTDSTLHKRFGAPGIFDATLIIRDKNDCLDSITKPQFITVKGPKANFSIASTATCQGQEVAFNDLSKADGNNAIQQWMWDYGDGHTDTLSGPPFHHRYDTSGTFDVILNVKDQGGCQGGIIKKGIVNIIANKADFYSPDTLACPGNAVRFMNKATGQGITYQWNFGDGQTSSEPNPVHVYMADGSYSVSLRISNQNGCSDSILRVDYIKVSTPKASFDFPNSYTSTCPPLVATLNNTSVNYKSLIWDFGDGGTSTLDKPIHVYNLPGKYTIRLVVTGYGGCKDTASKSLTIKGPIGSIVSVPVSGCTPPTLIKFTAKAFNTKSYQWDFGDGTVSNVTQDSTVEHTYTALGNYTPRLILVDVDGCKVSYPGKNSLVIDHLVPKFTMNTRTVCDSAFVSFKNQSSSYSLDSLGQPMTYHWDFGDPTTNNDTSNLENPSYFYNRKGKYIITLTASTAYGCREQIKDSIVVVRRSKAAITGPSDKCAGIPFNFKGSVTKGSPNVSWNWDFGNGQTASVQSPDPQTYMQGGNYDVKLLIINDDGCRDSVNKQISVHGLPQINAAPKEKTICLGQQVQLSANDGQTFHWSPSKSLSDPDISNPIASPNDNITYHVAVTTPFGCKGSDSVNINVVHPFKIQTSTDTALCAGTSATLFASGADKYYWSPPAGLNTQETPQPVATPKATTQYQVVGYDNNSCFTDTGYVNIKVNPLPKVYAGADQITPVGSQVQLKATDSSTNAKVVYWKWTPKDYLNCSNCQGPMSMPKDDITYKVTGTSGAGCESSDFVSINVTCSSGVVFIPNTFTPNNDQKNDVFYPRGSGIEKIVYLRIYNRWGEVVFERDNFNIDDITAGWDGTYKGKALKPDVYVYTAEMICSNHQRFKINGNVTLLR